MSKNFADCKDEVLDVIHSCFLYLCMMQLIAELRHESTKNEDLLIQQIQDTVRLFAPELVEEASNE